MDHDIRYLLDRGSDGDDEEALRLLDEALRVAPGNAGLLVLRSEALRNLELYTEAVEVARQACRAHESAGYTHAALGEALLDLAEDEDDPPELLREAEAALRAALLRSDELRSAEYWLAECLVRLGEKSEGLSRLAGVARASGWDGATVTRVARLIDEGVRPLPAEEREPARLHPDESFLLGAALRRANDLAAARVEFSLERDLDPLNREPDYELAWLAALEGDAKTALSLLEWPCGAEGFFEAWSLRGELLIGLGRVSEARTAFDRALHDARRWAEEGIVESLELRALGTPDAPSPERDGGLHEEVLRASLREQRLAACHEKPVDHALQMARAAGERFDLWECSPEAAWRIARTARAHGAPQLASEAWIAATKQSGEAWEVLTSGETHVVAGIIVLASWFAMTGEFEGRDCTVIAEAAFELMRRATADAKANDRNVAAYEERLAARRSELDALEAAGPMSLSESGRLVEAALGLPGGLGMLHELADLRPRRRF
jgi:tetratricopeptide (TPR) repeat protein